MTTFHSWQERVIYPVSVAVMIGCCLFAVAQAIERFAGTRIDLYIVSLVGMLAALQSFYTQALAAALRIEGVRRWLLDGLELALLLVLARLGLFASDAVTGQRVVRFDFFSFDYRWTLVIVLMILAWLFAKVAATQFARLRTLPQEHKETEYIDALWVSPYDRLNSLYLQGGIVLMFFAGIARMDLSQVQNMAGPPSTGIVLNALVYFGTGLILLAQAHFDSSRRRWFVDEVTVAPETGARRVRYSLILIGMAAVIAFIVPISYTLGLLDALRPVVAVLAFIANLVVELFVLIAALVGYLVALLLGRRAELPQAPPALTPIEVPPASTATGGGLLDWLNALNWANIQSLLSWLIAAAVIVYVARSYLRDHTDISIRLGQIGILRFLGKLLEAIWRSLAGIAEDAGELRDDLVQRLLSRLGAIRRPVGRLLGLGGIQPRERIRYLYLTILTRAAGRGIGRKRDQTPYEYEGFLAPRVPDVEEDVVHLTEAFVEARYSQQPVTDGDIAPVYEAWLRLRSALRRARPNP